MAEHPHYISEKQKLDELLEQGYLIDDVKDHLNGSEVLLKRADSTEPTTLQLGNANARKYVTTMLALQLANERRAT